MAIIVRRHWALMLSVPILLVAALLAILQGGGDTRRVRAQANAEAPPLPAAPLVETAASREEVQAYQRVQQIRSELALTAPDLAALGPSSAAARDVLTVLKSFVSADAGTLAEADAGVRQAARALQEANRRINVGPRDEAVLSSMAALRQNAAAAGARRDLVMASVISQVNALLSSEQQALWQAARANAIAAEQTGLTAAGPFRYVAGLTEAQIQRLDTIARQGGTLRLQAAGPELLDAGQAGQARLAEQNQRVAAAAVAAAEAQVLPLPAALKPRLATPAAHGTTPSLP